MATSGSHLNYCVPTVASALLDHALNQPNLGIAEMAVAFCVGRGLHTIANLQCCPLRPF
jgi:hypothetical protein